MKDIMPPRSSRPPARQRLQDLGFDPIEELVKTHRELASEAKLQKEIRDGQRVLLRADGKARAYNPAQHMQALAESGKIAGQLAEYSDKKAHQEVVSDKPSIPFQILLQQ